MTEDELELQPHGGALKRSRAVEDEAELLPDLTTRQADRIAALPDVYKTPYERLACELALGLDDADVVFKKYGMSADDGILLLGTPSFDAILTRISQEVRTSGLSFKMKARLQAEELLGVSFVMANDPLAPSSVRADLIKWTARVGGLEPKAADDDSKGKSGSGLNLTITFSGQAPQKVVASEPLTIENET